MSHCLPMKSKIAIMVDENRRKDTFHLKKFISKFDCCARQCLQRGFTIDSNNVMSWNLKIAYNRYELNSNVGSMNPLSLILEGRQLRTMMSGKLGVNQIRNRQLYPYIAVEEILSLPTGSIYNGFNQGFTNEPGYNNIHNHQYITYQMFAIGRYFLHKYCKVGLPYPELDKTLSPNFV